MKPENVLLTAGIWLQVIGTILMLLGLLACGTLCLWATLTPGG